MQYDNSHLEKKLWQWIDEVIIAENFCPFAKAVRETQGIALSFEESNSQQVILSHVERVLSEMENTPQIETAIIAITKGLEDFYDYLDVLDLVNPLIEELELEGVFQVASFHPDYQFADEPIDCASHFTNRSPIPLFHIIREKSITDALQSFKNPDKIPTRNKRHARKLGKSFFQTYLKKDS